MPDRYWNILRTYFCWHPILRIAALTIMPLLLVLEFAGPRNMVANSIGPQICALCICFVGIGLWVRLREQIVGERPLLWPNYVSPQLLIFSGLSIVFVCLWPAAVAIGGSALSVAGMIAVVAMLFAIIGWIIAIPSPLTFAAGTGVYMWLLFGSTSQPVSGLLSGERDVLASIIVLAAIAVAVAAVFQMLVLHEDNPAYRRRMTTGNWKPGSRTISPMISQSSTWWPQPRLHINAIASARGGAIARSRRWRAVVKPKWFTYFFVPAVNFSFLIFFPLPNAQRTVITTSMAFTLAVYLVFPSQLVPSSWGGAWPCLELDFLRPVNRRDFFHELGTAIAVQMLQAWSIIAAFFIAGAIIFRLPLVAVASILINSIGVLVFGFGLAVWTLRYRSTLVSNLSTFFMIIPGLALVIPQENAWRFSLYYTYLSGIGSAIIGICLTRSAYHRWLQTEIG